MPSAISAPIGALVSSTKDRAKRRHRRKRAGRAQGDDLKIIISIGTEIKEDEEAVPIVSLSDTDKDEWLEDEDDREESTERTECADSKFVSLFIALLRNAEAWE